MRQPGNSFYPLGNALVANNDLSPCFSKFWTLTWSRTQGESSRPRGRSLNLTSGTPLPKIDRSSTVFQPVVCLFVRARIIWRGGVNSASSSHDGCVGVRGARDVPLQAPERGRNNQRRQIHPQIQGGRHRGHNGKSARSLLLWCVYVSVCSGKYKHCSVTKEECHLKLCRLAGDAKCAVSL